MSVNRYFRFLESKNWKYIIHHIEYDAFEANNLKSISIKNHFPILDTI
ncbi:hypothetical protein HYD56_00870 [Mycoplasmopsis bovis]|nr:hypothetical protein HYD56_00870 [Mycoplasmopsis bovis]